MSTMYEEAAGIGESLKTIAEYLKFFADAKKKELDEKEKELKTRWDYEMKQKLSVNPNQDTCLYCGVTSHHIQRGNKIIGCVSCIFLVIEDFRSSP